MYLKNLNIKKLTIAFSACMILIIYLGLYSVNATDYPYALGYKYSTTSIRATATYHSSGNTRWTVSKPSIVSTGGKGGGAAKSGSYTAIEGSGVAHVYQNYTISATDYNYNTVSTTKQFVWGLKISNHTFVDSLCYVTNP